MKFILLILDSKHSFDWACDSYDDDDDDDGWAILKSFYFFSEFCTQSTDESKNLLK